jgi:serine/threonine protein kinase
LSNVEARAPDTRRMPPAPPVLPGYQLHDILGAGTTGTVWSATQLHTEQSVAVKVLQTGSVDVEYFSQEIHRLVSLAAHPNVVSVLGADLVHDPPFLVMPLLTSSLDSLVRTSGWEPGPVVSARAERWLRDMAAALQFMHRKGILHCDLKPANVLIDQNETLRLVDFGQSQVQGTPGFNLGTFWFMPPEQALLTAAPLHYPVPETSWDIYALGATMYRVLTGKLPRLTPQIDSRLSEESDLLQRLAIYRHHLLVTPLVPVHQFNPHVDADLAAIIEHCLELEPGRRYLSVDDILIDLARRTDRLPVLARPQTPGYVFSRFASRNWLTLLAFLVVLGLQTSQVAVNMENAKRATIQRLTDEMDRSIRVFKVIEVSHYLWLDVLARTEAADPALHKVVHTTDFPTRLSSFQDVIDSYQPPKDQDLLLLLTDEHGSTVVRTDQKAPPTENLSNWPGIKDVLAGANDPVHGYQVVGDKLYRTTAVPWYRGQYLDGVFLVGQQISNSALYDLEEATNVDFTFTDGQHVYATTVKEENREALVAQAGSSTESHTIEIKGEGFRVKSDNLMPSVHVITAVAVDPQIKPIKDLENSYLAQAAIALLVGGGIFGYLLWRSETQRTR